MKLLSEAAKLAEIVESGPLIAQARNFRGYVARQQGHPHEMTRWFLAAYETPGAHPAQRMGDAAQAAHGYAQLGQRDTARRLLDDALGLSDAATDTPPDTAYWLTPMFQRLNIGLACLGLGRPGDAAEHIRTGLRGLPLISKVQSGPRSTGVHCGLHLPERDGRRAKVYAGRGRIRRCIR